MTTTTNFEASIEAYLEAPNLDKYQKYSDYLHDFNLFLDFLQKHENVASAQTRRRIKQPTVASVQSVQERIRPLLKLEGDSDWSDGGKQVSSPVKPIGSERAASRSLLGLHELRVQKEPSGPGTHVGASRAPIKSDPVVLPNPTASNVSATLLGKKHCRRLLQEYCSADLAMRFVSSDWISRDPNVFPRMLDYVRRRADFAGRKLSVDDVHIRKMDKQPDAPGLVEYPDYKAIFEAAESGFSSSDA